MENKNLILAVILSFGFLMLWNYIVVPKITPKTVVETTSQGSLSNPTTMTNGTDVLPSEKTKSAPDLVFQNKNLYIQIAARGAGIRSWTLQHDGLPYNLVHFPDEVNLPLQTFPEATFQGHIQNQDITLKTTLSNGLRFKKIISINKDNFLHALRFEFENPTRQAIQVNDWTFGWGPGLGTVASEWSDNHSMIRALSFGKLRTTTLKGGDEAPLGKWAGLDNRYNLIAFIPKTENPVTIVGLGKIDHTQVVLRQSFSIPARGKVSIPYEFYVGPKGYTHLLTYGKDLQGSVDFGFFSYIGKVMLRGIYTFQKWTGNYGWAIMLLTVCIQLLVLPLTFKSYKAAASMKKLQPQIVALQAQYKNDPKRLNIEMLNLWKKAGANPLGGCLPMLPQIPIFFALYTTIRNAYELHGEPWILWVHDLSAKDPYYILPILMGGAMFVSQKMSGATMDPNQRQMMMIMPIMFTFIMSSSPSGLVLYWFTSNIISITSMYLFQRYFDSHTPRRITPTVIDTTLIKD